MKWRKPSEELIKTFEAIVPGPPAVTRKMFGFPAAFVNGNMFIGLHQEDMLVRLPEEPRTKLLGISGARTFEPMPGRPMREYVVVPPTLLSDRKKLESWVAKAFEYAVTLEPKAVSTKNTTRRKQSSSRRQKSTK
jgi:TfoX/Sxy family transcriptional regulator of competence genes